MLIDRDVSGAEEWVLFIIIFFLIYLYLLIFI